MQAFKTQLLWVLSFAGLIFFSSCEKAIEKSTWRFSSLDGGKPTSRQKKQMDETLSTTKLIDWKGRRLFREELHYLKWPIENSKVQIIVGEDGQSVATGPDIPDNSFWQFHSHEDWEKRLASIWSLIQSQKKKFEKAEVLAEPEVFWRADGQVFKPAIRLDVATKDPYQVLRIAADYHGKVLSETKVSSHLANGYGLVFPENPKDSILELVPLRDLCGNGKLCRQGLRVYSSISNEAFSEGHTFQYRPDEPEFNQVQAYFFGHQFLDFMETELGFKYPSQLKFKMHLGGFRKTNAAFYYRGQVHLGDGDGIEYRGIPRDPTVVSHELAHAYIELLAGLPTRDEGGAINEGLADFFAAVWTGNPLMGSFSYLKSQSRRNLKNSLRADLDLGKGVYGDSLVVSGTFWEVFEELGETSSLTLAFEFLLLLGPHGELSDIGPVLKSAGQRVLNLEDYQKLNHILNSRGWFDLSPAE